MNLFFQEEFARRLSISTYHNHLILKGGYFIYTLSQFESRPTIDSDYLLKSYHNDKIFIEKLIISIINEKQINDFFRIEYLECREISKANEYPGIRVKLLGYLGKTRTPFSIDIGVGDKVVPKPIERQLPVLLDDFLSPILLCYSVESVIAEKFDAILRFMEYTGRMKDFYDIYYLSKYEVINTKDLQNALQETFQTRHTFFNDRSLHNLRTLIINENVLMRWEIFCDKVLKFDLDFSEVINTMIKLLNEPLNSILDEEKLYDK